MGTRPKKDTSSLYEAAQAWGGEALYIVQSVRGKGNHQHTVQVRGLLARLYGGRAPRPRYPTEGRSGCRSRLTELVWLYQTVLEQEPSLWRQVAKDLVLIRLVMDHVENDIHLAAERHNNNVLTRLNSTIEKLAVSELM